jgi:hypothetical protein
MLGEMWEAVDGGAALVESLEHLFSEKRRLAAQTNWRKILEKKNLFFFKTSLNLFLKRKFWNF